MSTRVALPILAFFGAGLLFVVEPMLGKWILPVVGGSPATWTACMAFFQALLLAGYGYAAWTTRYLAPRWQLGLHVALALAAAIFLLLAPLPARPELSASMPNLSIFWLLLRRVGLAYFVLASTVPLFESWAAPVRLFAFSNAGSLAGLLCFPFLLEPFFEIRSALLSWRLAFLAFAAGVVAAVVGVARAARASSKNHAASRTRAGFLRHVRWVLLAFVPSVVLLAATSHVSIDIGASPVAWIVPLALYLVSFVVAFGSWRPGWQSPMLGLLVAGAFGVALGDYRSVAGSVSVQLGATMAALFAACLLCHVEIALDRPDDDGLALYYVSIALGGALGGVFVSWLAPVVFDDYYELPLALLATFLILALGSRSHWPRLARLGLALGGGLVAPLLIAQVLARAQTTTSEGKIVERSRSFLGPLAVVDLARGRVLENGRIQHGMELRDPALHHLPTMYFGPGTALATVLKRHHADRPRRVGVIGLGAGTIAAYARHGDSFRFYEIDPRVVDIARRDFDFLAGSAGRIEIVLADGRLALERERTHEFDVLVLDAFCSDAVPVHLITREAFASYFRQLASDGVIAVQLSSRSLDLDRVVSASARANGATCVIVETPSNAAENVTHAIWGLVARDPNLLAALARSLPVRAVRGSEVLWTDARASVWSILR